MFMHDLNRGLCDKCRKPCSAVAEVHMRVPGKATLYANEVVKLCAVCRVVFQGKWKYRFR